MSGRLAAKMALKGAPNWVAYGATRAAVLGLTKAIASTAHAWSSYEPKPRCEVN